MSEHSDIEYNQELMKKKLIDYISIKDTIIGINQYDYDTLY